MTAKHILKAVAATAVACFFTGCCTTARDSGMELADALREAAIVSSHASFSQEDCASDFSRKILTQCLDLGIPIQQVHKVEQMSPASEAAASAAAALPATSTNMLGRAFVSPFGIPLNERALVVIGTGEPDGVSAFSCTYSGDLKMISWNKTAAGIRNGFYPVSMEYDDSGVTMTGYYLQTGEPDSLKLRIGAVAQ